MSPGHEWLVVRPLLSKEKSSVKTILQQMQSDVDHMVVSSKSMTRTFAISISDQVDAKGYVIEDERKGVMAFIVATKQVSSLLKAVKKVLDNGKVKQKKFDVFSKNGMLAAFACTRNLFYSKALRRMFETFFDAHVEDPNNFALVVDKYEDLVLSFLSDLNMRKTYEANSFVVIKRNSA